MTFYGNPRMDEHSRAHLHESPAVVVVPLVLLAIPSAVIGLLTVEPLLFGRYFGESIKVLPGHGAMGELAAAFLRGGTNTINRVGAFFAHGFQSLPFLLALGGFIAAWVLYIRAPHLPGVIAARLRALYTLLYNKYFVDEFNELVFARGARALGRALWRGGDQRLIDGLAVNGTARVVGWVSMAIRHIQSGYVYHYAFAMILGLFLLITFFLHR
jgi:NADH-quinone oxidoreductase subunit L